MNRIILSFIFAAIVNFSMAQDFRCSDYYRYQSEGKIRDQFNSLHRGTDLSVNYDLKYSRFYWKIDPDSNYIIGTVTHYFTPVINTLDVLAFELAPSLTVDSVIYHRKKITPERNDYQMLIRLPDTVTGLLDSVTISYQGKPPLNWGSFEQDFHANQAIIWTLSEPYGARDWWPCKQSLSEKIDSADVFIETPANCKAASNGVLVSSIPTSFGKMHHWKHRYPIAAYLVAFAVTNYSEYSIYAHYNGDSVRILNYIFPEDSSVSRQNINRTVPIMEAYMDKFGKYPFFMEKYGHAQFGRNGGMEHQTMSFMGFFNDMLIGHEMAHQWFGDKVTCGSWSDIWLNEGFATFAEGITFEALYPKADLVKWRKGLVNNITKESGGTVYVYGNDTNDIARVFDHRLSYQKGGMVLQMLRLLVGDSAFSAGMKNYLNYPEIAYGYAKTEDFRKHIEAASGKKLLDFFNDWIYFEGYPSYTISWYQSAGNLHITISQKQSLPAVSYFELPVPLQLNINGKDSMILLYNNKDLQSYDLSIDDKIDSITFDPDYLLISRNNQVINYGIIEDSMSPNLAFYPNPFRYIFTIDFRSSSEILQKVQIFNMKGQLIEERNYGGKLYNPGSSVEIRTSIKQAGLYIVKVITNDKSYTYPLTKVID